jgi:hypothetical protein
MIAEFFKQIGYGSAFLYAGVTYAGFFWLESELSPEAKTELARTLNLTQYDRQQVASALLEIFDRVYAKPLLQKRAFLRSTIFTVSMMALYIFELRFFLFGETLPDLHGGVVQDDFRWYVIGYAFALSLVSNILSDYLSLFFIRPWISGFGTKTVTALVTGALVGILVVDTAGAVKLGVINFLVSAPLNETVAGYGTIFSMPAFVVFAWLPLLATGILVVRSLRLFSRLVGKTLWIFKDGKERPLKVVGYVAAAIVLAVTIAWQTVYKDSMSKNGEGMRSIFLNAPAQIAVRK